MQTTVAESYAPPRDLPVAHVDTETRASFITKTYLHLLGAILAFTAIEAALFASGAAIPIAQAMLSLPWLAILGAFMVVSWLTSRVASQVESLPLQYAALFAFIVAEALLFVPMLVIAVIQAPGVLPIAAAVTVAAFTGLTFIAMATRKDFSFLRSLLLWGGVLAVVAIVAGALFGFELGLGFSILMVAFAGGAILYDTSNILHHYPRDRYVAASLALFASVALMFWYVLRIFLSRD